MRGILHEKIQLYIYKPSINKGLANLNRTHPGELTAQK